MVEYDMLETLRSQIDNTDTEIIFLLKRRLQTGRKIAQYKFKNNLEIFQKERENELFTQKMAKAITMDLDKEFVLDIFERIVEESKKIQKAEIKKLEEKQSK